MDGKGRRAAFFIGLALVVAAPLPFGAVGDAPRALLAFALAAALGLLWVDRRALGEGARWTWRLAAATAVFGLLYLAPLPPSAVAALSPRLAGEARASLAFPGADPALSAAESSLAAAAGGVRTEATWRPLGADPDANLEGLTRLGLALAAFLVGLAATARREDRRLAAGAAAVAALVEAVYALAESLSGSYSIWGWKNIYYSGRACGTFVCPNHFAALLSLGLFALVGLLASRPRGEAPERDEERAPGPARMLVFATVAGVVIVALLWSRSRGALVAGAVGVALFAAGLAAKRGVGRDRGLVLGAAAALVAVLVVGAAMLKPVTVLNASVETAPEQMAGRVELMTFGAQVARAYPLVGIGPGAFPVVHRNFRPDDMGLVYDHVHSDYTEWWVETGPLGVALLAAWLVFLTVGAARVFGGHRDRALTLALAAGLAALGIHEIAEFSLQLPGVAVPAAFLAGALLAPLLWHPAPAERIPSKPGAARGIVLAALAAGLAVLGLATFWTARTFGAGTLRALPAFASPDQLREYSQAETQEVLARLGDRAPGAAETRRLGLAYLAAQRAAARAPLRADAQIAAWESGEALSLALGDRAPAGAPEALRHYLERASALDPANRPLRLRVGRYWLALGDRARGFAQFRRLLAMDASFAPAVYDTLGGKDAALEDLLAATPNKPGAALALGLYLRGARQDLAGAQMVFERAVARNPEDPALRRELAGTYLWRQRPDLALATLDARPLPPKRNDRYNAVQLRISTLLALKRLDEAEAALGEMARLGASPRYGLLVRGQIAGARGDSAAASRLYAEALDHPAGMTKWERLQLLLAVAREENRQGHVSQALAGYRKVQEADPNNAEARAFFAQLDPGKR